MPAGPKRNDPPKANEPRKIKAAAAWRREAAGTYRSSDDRFTITSEGSGRWFLRDAEQPDDFGQPRMTGPYPTLDDAKAGADAQRAQKPEASPLAVRVKERGGKRASTGGRGTKPAGSADAQAPAGRAPRAKPKPATWLERLEERDRTAARRVRALVRTLDGLDIPNAEELVRRDIEGGRPAVTEAALAKALRDALAAALDPDELVPAARRRVPGLKGEPDDLVAYAAFVASRVVGALLGEISVGERREHRDPDLPGWELVEDAGARRRLLVTPSDVLGKGRS